jgi:hypothetical protein
MDNHAVVSDDILREFRKREQFAAQIKIRPYEEVKAFLDGIAVETVIDSAKGLLKHFERLGKQGL